MAASQGRHTLLATAIRATLGCVVLAALPATPAWADMPAASAPHFTIAAGPLGNVLAEFAATAGVQLVFDPAQLGGLHSPGLQGRYDVRAGFEQVLSGSGWQVVPQGGNAYALLRSPPQSAPVTLSAVTVTGQAERSGLTEGTGRYTTGGPAGKAATGLALSLRETPQSVTVVTRQRMDDQALNALADVAQQTVGVFNQRSGTTIGGYSNFYVRGYAMESVQVDGTFASPFNWTYFGNASMDTAIYDSVTIVRGATGLLTGAGDPSGSISLARKRPTGDFSAALEGSLGRWGQRRAVADIGGPLHAAGALRARLVAAHDEGDTWIERYEGKKSLAYGVVEADLSDQTLLTVTLEHGRENSEQQNYYYGLPLLDAAGNPTPRSRTHNTAPEWADKRDRRTNLSLTLRHEFNDDWYANLSYARNRRDVEDHWIIVYSPAASGLTNVWGHEMDFEDRTDALEATINGRFSLWGRQHDLIAGISRSEIGRDAALNRGRMVTAQLTDGALQYAGEPDWYAGNNNPFDQVTKQTGVYLTARLRPVDRLAVILGSRWSQWETRRKTKAGVVTDDRRESGVFTPYAGVVYDLTDNLSTYASYTEIFKPQSNQDTSGRVLDPEEGMNYELGLKGEWFSGRLNASVAAFEVRKDHLAIQDGGNRTPEGNQAYRAADDTKGRGWELEVGGELARGWQVQGGYTRVVIRDSDGQRLRTEQPVHLFKLFSSYTPQSQPRLTLGGGVNWQSEIYQDNALRERYTQQRYAVVNLMARYALNSDLSLSLNLNNAFDKAYRTALAYHDYGAPRNLTATLKYQF